uniref:Phosphoribosylformylglycinamidine synthase subunit PurQ n=1 Tax=Candidatus Methanophaga sp. ANME-1 ERB7 TaxID=2759913 RepID=A0A7G9Z833_9EURY|nr:phosphoribosylformylglycinamidine synthase subunit PurQ [Methanosarcinales archaeon ANME-1 ERB7]
MMPARICVLRIEGTNCELETFRSFKRLGAAAEIVHLKQLIGAVKEREKRKLKDYDLLVIPGGFSSGDYIRAGAILAARIRGTLGEEIDDFIRDGKPILGICNGFQVLVEMGLLPGLAYEKIGLQQAALTTNDSARFECRSVYLRQENRGNCVFTKGIEKGRIMKMPCAHAEGKFFISEKRREAYLQLLEENDQIVFRYIDPEGGYASYPWNPNGSVDNIAGICDPSGNILGLMPHPERAFYAYLDSEWSRRAKGREEGRGAYGDGKAIFEAVLNYLSRKAYI